MSEISTSVQLLDKMPVPSMASYTALSIALLTGAAYYSVENSATEEWRSNPNYTTGIAEAWTFLGGSSVLLESRERPPTLRLVEIAVHLATDPLCIWALVNMAYCLLALLGKLIQVLVFGQLRVSEEQHLKDKFWNFIFYKFIFIFGVMNVQYVEQVLGWVAWFSLLGFLHLMTVLSKDRFQYLSFSPSIPAGVHVRLVGLLCAVQVACVLCFGVCILCGIYHGLHTFALMVAEVALVSLNAAYVLARYTLHVVDAKTSERLWDSRAGCVYYTELGFELATLVVDFLHHLHMLVWTNTMLSMASLVISVQLRWAFNEIRRRILKHRNYLKVLRHMMASYPMASLDELHKNSDDCAICWDLMSTARKLPCGHLFHNACLRSWLEQDTSCPTCRMTLQSTESSEGFFGSLSFSSLQVEASASSHPRQMPMPPLQGGPQVTNHQFHFDGSRYFSWLPIVSLEVSHTNLRPPAEQLTAVASAENPQLNRIPHASSAGDDSASGHKNPKIHQFSRDSTVFQNTTLSNTSVIANQETSSSPTATQRGELDRPLTIDDLWDQLEEVHGPPDHEGRVFPIAAAVRHTELQQRKRDLLDASRRRFLERTQRTRS